MAVINVYEQYFAAEGSFNGVERRGALVMLVSDSEAGNIRYEAAVTFFPHENEEDYAVSYDAYFSRILYEGKGRRSRKKEQQFLEELPEIIKALAREAGMRICFECPLKEARTA